MATAPGADKRIRTVMLTDAGRAERQVLDDAQRRARRAPAGTAAATSQRTRLVEAMGTVERLLTAGLVEIAEEDQDSDAARYCLGRYYAELETRFDAGFDPAKALPVDGAVFLVARLRGEPVGCGAIKLEDSYLKRMWIAPEVRGLGLGRRLLRELEQRSQTGRRTAGDEPQPDRGDRALQGRGLRRGRAVQRRALRPPLVREAAQPRDTP